MSDSSRITWKQANFDSKDNFSLAQYFDTTLLLISATGLLTGVWFLKALRKWYRDRARLLYLASKLPGPPALPLIGNALQFACNSDETLNRIVQISNNYPTPMRFWLGPKLFVIITEPQDYETILSCQKANYKDPVYRFMEPFVGQGLVTSSGAIHRSHRKIIMPMLNNKILNEYMEYFNNHSHLCVELLDCKVGEGEFNIQPFLIRLTFDMITETILGVPGKSQSHGYKNLVYWTEKMYELIHLRMMKVWLHPDYIFSFTELAKEQKDAQNIIHGFIESVVARKKKEYFALERGVIVSDRPRVMMLEQIIDQVTKDHLMTDEEIRDEIYTIFTAAQDTTALISSFALLNLAMNKDIQERVREEIKIVVGDECVTNEHLTDLKYTEMVIKETLRLYPIAPLMVRQATGDIDLEKCILPKGCSIVMVPFATHRSEKFWTEPNKFNPDRFLPENANERHPYTYIPFSSGFRGCIGKKYAMMCLKTILVHIVRGYQLSTTKNLKDLRLKTDISIRSKDGYMLSINRIES